jgi:hypothetical protein
VLALGVLPFLVFGLTNDAVVTILGAFAGSGG